jgi:hypothetical protein
LTGFLLGYVSLGMSRQLLLKLWLALSQSLLIARHADDMTSESHGVASTPRR